MDLHKLLIRQLRRLNLTEDKLPTEFEAWESFLKLISKTYTEADQERYLLDRSMEISSRELQTLNRKLENAQHLAHLGYWSFNIKTHKLYWSRELQDMLGYPPDVPAPNYEDIIKLIHYQDMDNLPHLLNYFYKEKNQNYEKEIRIQHQNGEYKWFYVIGHVQYDEHGLLTNEIAGVAIDVTRRKAIEEEVEQLHQELLMTARKAGMADVARSILHNVGNVLNSMNVSIDLIDEQIEKKPSENIRVVQEMIENNMENLGHYFSMDKKGKLIPQYLVSMLEKYQAIQKNVYAELIDLKEKIKHIKEITAMQESISTEKRLTQNVSLPEALDNAITLGGLGMNKNEIKIEKDFTNHTMIQTDKAKLLQILINIMQNAKDSLLEREEGTNKIINIKIEENPNDQNVKIYLTDNGLGILKEHLTQIFSLGFTTKEKGHGFGLHSSAIAANELGGKLEALSEGQGKGATFILTLPMK